MNACRALLATALLSALPGLAAAYAFGIAAPNGQSVEQNQLSGKPVIWSVPQQSFYFNFGGDYDTNAAAAIGDWNAVGTAMQWSLGSTAAQPCNSTDHINSAGWRATTCDNAAFGDAIAVTKRSYVKIGDSWYFSDADIVVDNSQQWAPHYDGSLRNDHTQDFRRVILHELGHAMGLDHPDDAGQHVTAIMNSQISAVDSLQQDDKDGITFLYSGISDSTTNTANQISSSSGGGGGGWLIPLLAFAARLRRGKKLP